MTPDDTAANPPRKHIALIGFMGAGKTTVGKLLARLAGVDFVDLDEAIVASTGQSVVDYFKEHGEVAFRAQERAVLRDVLARPGAMVVATGGGTFIDPVTRQALQAQAHCIFLQGDFESLWERLNLEERATRPLLGGPDAKSSAARLLQQRGVLYALCEITVETGDKTPEQIVQEIAHLLALPKPPLAEPAQTPTVVQVTAGQGVYPISLRPAAGAWMAEAIAEVAAGGPIAILTDAHVGPLHAQSLLEALQRLGLVALLHEVPAGEASKSLGTAGMLYDALLSRQLGRNAVLVALGGGVVGDLAGFVASTYLRGIKYVQVPTTTLAAVDSSVGGKTAVNTPRGKNLVGTFYPPQAVLVAVGHLATQTPRQHASGLVEAVKMAATHDAQLFSDIAQAAEPLMALEPTRLLDVVARAVAIKAAVVSRDEREQGERAVLNVGHTVGHAIEQGSQFTLLHGEAVALGMMAEAEWAQSVGKCAAETVAALQAALSALNMPTQWRRVKIDIEAMSLDKKRTADTVLLPIVPQIGAYALCHVGLGELTQFVAQRT